MSPVKTLGLSLGASLLALGSVALLGSILARNARAHSHELPQWTGLPVPADVTPASLQASGRKLYLNSCAHCHGTDASGDEGPDLHGLQVSDRRMASVISHGIKGEMPSFAKKHPPVEIAALIAYLHTLE
ncbi:MAG: cytochrome c [Opitutaceae bacterium]|jgi:mono/diheme cytochrome c family protein